MSDLRDKLDYIPRFFKVISKEGDLVPMVLWRVQKHYLQNRGRKNICLKPRQVGFSSVVEADNAHDMFTLAYQRQAVITHDTETSEFLLQTIHRFHRHLPREMQPEVDWSSATRIRLPKLDNYIYIDSAKSDSIGIGHTLNAAHLSEVSRWSPRKARDLFAEISQTVPEEGRITIESTPRGRVGLFFELYDAAKRKEIPYQTFFYPWWWVEEYKRPVSEKLIFTKEEQSLIGNYSLTPEQIAFRREKIAEIKDLFFQEYPENDMDCWLSSEMAIIDGVSLRPYYTQTKEGKVTGILTIWKDVVGGHKYVIGADVASGSARDYSVASVIDVRNMEYVARLRGKIHTDLFAEELFRLGTHYNEAEIAVERIGHGHSVLRVLLEKNYPNLYYHLDYDEFMRQNLSDVGWKTSLKTKPLMVNAMISAFRSGDLISYSENLLYETSSLVWEGGIDSKVKMVSGGNDDEFTAVSIALQVRELTPIFEGLKTPSVRSYVTL